MVSARSARRVRIWIMKLDYFPVKYKYFKYSSGIQIVYGYQVRVRNTREATLMNTKCHLLRSCLPKQKEVGLKYTQYTSESWNNHGHNNHIKAHWLEWFINYNESGVLMGYSRKEHGIPSVWYIVWYCKIANILRPFQ